MSAPLRLDEEGRPWPNMPRIVTYESEQASGFRMVSFYFYGRQRTHKLVLRFDRNSVTLSQRRGHNGPWVELKTWVVLA